MGTPLSDVAAAGGSPGIRAGELDTLCTRLTDRLGILLAHAELLEKKAHPGPDQVRARLLLDSALEALAAARELEAFVHQRLV
jgi:hypothetical protein